MASAISQLKSALLRVFGDHPVRIIIAKDFSFPVMTIESGVCLWTSPENGDIVFELKPYKQYWFDYVKLPIVTKGGKVMLPVKWNGKTCWIDNQWLQEVA